MPARIFKLRDFTPDTYILFSTRLVRLFAYGFLSVVLVLYLAQVGLSEVQIGLMITLTLVGDAAISLYITTHADRAGRKRMLIVGAGLMLFAGVLFALTGDFALLLLAATIGVISPSGNEVGPFLAVEQAALSQIVPNERRTQIFAWYTLVGSFATAFGALFGGGLAQILQNAGVTQIDSYRAVVLGYALLGVVLAIMFSRLSPSVEAAVTPQVARSLLGLHRSRDAVFKLAALFSLDAFGGGFVITSFVAYWFYLSWGVQPGALGAIFFGANIMAGISALLAARVAARFGLINTMVFTHIPSNVLLIMVPLMPTLPLAIITLFLRFSISQMDVPTRQSYTMAVVSPDERSAAAGVTGIARTTGAAMAPMLVGPLLSNPMLMNVPFYLAGGLKIVYDLLLYRNFRAVKPPEERAAAAR